MRDVRPGVFERLLEWLMPRRRHRRELRERLRAEVRHESTRLRVCREQRKKTIDENDRAFETVMGLPARPSITRRQA